MMAAAASGSVSAVPLRPERVCSKSRRACSSTGEPSTFARGQRGPRCTRSCRSDDPTLQLGLADALRDHPLDSSLGLAQREEVAKARCPVEVDEAPRSLEADATAMLSAAKLSLRSLKPFPAA